MATNGNVPGVYLVALRTRLGMTQRGFAQAFGLTHAVLREWEQQRRVLTGPALAYLQAIAGDPEGVRRARDVTIAQSRAPRAAAAPPSTTNGNERFAASGVRISISKPSAAARASAPAPSPPKAAPATSSARVEELLAEHRRQQEAAARPSPTKVTLPAARPAHPPIR